MSSASRPSGLSSVYRNGLDVGSSPAFRYQLSGPPIPVDASHGTGIRDLVHPATLSGIMAGASVALVEAHPNPLIAKSDGHQGLFAEQLHALANRLQPSERAGLPPDEAVHLVVEAQQILGEVATVLTRDSRDECSFHRANCPSDAVGSEVFMTE